MTEFKLNLFLKNELLSFYNKDLTNKKSITILHDNFNCIIDILKLKGDEISLFPREKTFSLRYLEKSSDFDTLLKTIDLTKNNVIFYFSDYHIYDDLSTLQNEKKVDFNDFTVYPGSIFEFYKNQYHITEAIEWNHRLNIFKEYTLKIADFFIQNLETYKQRFINISSIISNTKEIDKRKNDFIISIFFKNLLNDTSTQTKQYYIIERLFSDQRLIEELLNSSAKALFALLKDLIGEIFSPQLSNLFIYYIEQEKIEIIQNLIVSIGIFSQIKTDLDLKTFKKYKTRVSPYLDDLNLQSDYPDGTKIFNDDLFINLKDVVINFLKYELNSDIFIQQKEFLFKFRSTELIQSIERKLEFFSREIIIDESDLKDIEQLANKTLTYSGLAHFNRILLSKLFVIIPGAKLNLIKSSDHIIARYSYILDKFKDNIYYKINLEEFRLHFKFLRNIIKLFNYIKDLDELDISDLKTFELEHWVEIFNDVILPIDKICWDSRERYRLFWVMENIPQQLEEYMAALSRTVVNRVKKINIIFNEYLKANYPSWVRDPNNSPITVVNVIKKFFKIKPGFDYYLFLILDCCRVDIWDKLKKYILNDFPNLNASTITGLSILPTSTHWARRAITTGKYPKDQYGKWNEGKDFLDLMKENYNRRFPRIESLRSEKPIYNINCELISKNEEAIRNLTNTYKVQYCVFNFSDKVSHNFEMSVNRKLIKKIYSDKIKPLIRKLLDLYTKPVIYFATDHGIAKCDELIDWKGSNFERHWSNRDDFPSHKNRWFAAVNRGTYTRNSILRIESNFNDWGLRSEIYLKGSMVPIAGYYFGSAYDDFLGDFGEKTTYYAHGGASFFELLIPFSILSKNHKSDDYPLEPVIELIISPSDPSKNKIIVKNLNKSPIKNLNLEFSIENYIFNLQRFRIDPEDKATISINIPDLNTTDFQSRIELEYKERKFFFEHK